MKKLTLLLLLCLPLNLVAQEIFIAYGKVNSSFDFKNSQGIALDNLHAENNNFLGIGYLIPLKNESTVVSLGLQYATYGAKGSSNTLNNYFTWEMDYLALGAQVNQDIFQLRDFKFYLKAGFSAEYLLNGNQTINQKVYDLKGVEEFKSIAVFYKGGIGIKFPISRFSHVFFQYVYGRSFDLKDKSGDSQEKLNINVHHLGLGLSIAL